MVKVCSPSELSGVVDGLFTGANGGVCQQIKDSEAHDVWTGGICAPAPAPAACWLKRQRFRFEIHNGITIMNFHRLHQKVGRTKITQALTLASSRANWEQIAARNRPPNK